MGLLTTAVAERLGGHGDICVGCFGNKPGKLETEKRFRSIPSENLDKVPLVDLIRLKERFDENPGSLSEALSETVGARSVPEERSRRWIDKGFDSCLLADWKVHPKALVEGVLPLLAPSAAFAVYSSGLTSLVECHNALMKRKDVVLVELQDLWWREFQVRGSLRDRVARAFAGASRSNATHDGCEMPERIRSVGDQGPLRAASVGESRSDRWPGRNSLFDPAEKVCIDRSVKETETVRIASESTIGTTSAKCGRRRTRFVRAYVARLPSGATRSRDEKPRVVRRRIRARFESSDSGTLLPKTPLQGNLFSDASSNDAHSQRVFAPNIR